MASTQHIARNLRRLSVLTVGTVLFAASVSPPVQAQSGRPDTRTLSCAQVQSLLRQNGAAVLRTGQNTFDRYVFTKAFCPHGDVAKREWVPTRDVRSCQVRVCIDPKILRFDRFD